MDCAAEILLNLTKLLQILEFQFLQLILEQFKYFAVKKKSLFSLKGVSGGEFDSTDYLMFYGKGNDGWFDKGTYFKPEHQVKPRYSLIGLPKPIQHFHQICIYAHGRPSS